MFSERSCTPSGERVVLSADAVLSADVDALHSAEPHLLDQHRRYPRRRIPAPAEFELLVQRVDQFLFVRNPLVISYVGHVHPGLGTLLHRLAGVSNLLQRFRNGLRQLGALCHVDRGSL